MLTQNWLRSKLTPTGKHYQTSRALNAPFHLPQVITKAKGKLISDSLSSSLVPLVTSYFFAYLK